MRDYSIFIPVRVGSTRLPFKQFIDIDGICALDRLVAALERKVPRDALTVITTEEDADQYVASFCEQRGVRIIRGDSKDVLSRFLKACAAVPARWYARVNGDSIGVPIEVLTEFVSLAAVEYSDCDVFTTVDSGLPSGVHLEAVKHKLVMQIAQGELDASEAEREHVFPLFYRLADCMLRASAGADAAQVKLSLDTVQDLENRRTLARRGIEITHVADLAAAASALEEERMLRPFLGKHGPLLIAEIGGNHEGDYHAAKKLIDQALDTPADVIKLQIYSPDLLVNKELDPARHAHFSRFALPYEQYCALLQRIRDGGKLACASVWSVEELDAFEAQLDILKVGSGDFDDYLMLERIARCEQPIVLSTGLCEFSVVQRVMNYMTGALEVPAHRLSLLQCTSMYPIPKAEANLAVLQTYSHAFPGVAIGYSDHVIGADALVAAAAMGAKVLEFHFSDDPTNVRFRDHLVSLDRDGVRALGARIVDLEVMRGSPTKRVTMLEQATRHDYSFKKGLFLRRDKAAGDRIEREDLIALRPRQGLVPADAPALIGRRVLRDVKSLETLSFDFFAD